LGASGNPKADSSTFVIRTKDKRLTVKLKDISAGKVFAEIADQTGIQIIFYGSTEGTLSADFSDLPVDKGLRRLTRGFDHVFIYRRREKRGSRPEIEKVIIYSKSNERHKKGLGPGGIPNKKKPQRKFNDAFLDSMVKALEDKDPEIREEAVDLLAKLKDERVTN
jgi:hypothetical protein